MAFLFLLYTRYHVDKQRYYVGFMRERGRGKRERDRERTYEHA
jgi:hypothetical protein